MTYHVSNKESTFFSSRNFVVDIHQKTGQLMSRGSATQVGGAGGGGGGGADYSGTLQVSTRVKKGFLFTLPFLKKIVICQK
jgi:hypothetical protein